MLSKTTIETCEIDPLLLLLLVELIDDHLLSFTSVVSNSLLTGSFPTVFKSTVVRLLLKQKNSWLIDTENLKNYRPFSNLPFLPWSLKRSPTFNYPRIFKAIIFSTPISLPIAQAMALKLPFLKLLMISSQLWMWIMSAVSAWPAHRFWYYWSLHFTLQTPSYWWHFWHCMLCLSFSNTSLVKVIIYQSTCSTGIFSSTCFLFLFLSFAFLLHLLPGHIAALCLTSNIYLYTDNT